MVHVLCVCVCVCVCGCVICEIYVVWCLQMFVFQVFIFFAARDTETADGGSPVGG